jgi:hypothetical protein
MAADRNVASRNLLNRFIETSCIPCGNPRESVLLLFFLFCRRREYDRRAPDSRVADADREKQSPPQGFSPMTGRKM